jgi:hypothetical protein
MTKLKHELWEENVDGARTLTFCLTGPHGDQARSMLGPDAKLIWTVEAGTHFEAMTKYYEFMDWGQYKTEHDWDLQPYPEEWANGSL